MPIEEAVNALEFATRNDWRDWLIQNHQQSNGVWIFIYKKKAEVIGINYEEAVEEALCFGWIDSKMKSIDETKFIQRFTPRKKGSIWSDLNKTRIEKLIQEGKMVESGLAKIEEAKLSGKWENSYSAQRSSAIPEELITELKKNDQAWNNFQKFSNSDKLMYIYYINSGKKHETQQRRIMKVVERSKLNKKPGIDM